MIKGFLSNNTSIAISPLWLQTLEKTYGFRRRNETMIYTCKKTKVCRKDALVSYTKLALKMRSLLVLRVQRLE